VKGEITPGKRKGDKSVKSMINLIEKSNHSINSICSVLIKFDKDVFEERFIYACAHTSSLLSSKHRAIEAVFLLPPSFSETKEVPRFWDNKNIDIDRSLRLKPATTGRLRNVGGTSEELNAEIRRAARVHEYARVTKACLLPRATFFSTYLSRTRTDRPRVLRHVGDPPAAACTISPPFLPRFNMRR